MQQAKARRAAGTPPAASRHPARREPAPSGRALRARAVRPVVRERHVARLSPVVGKRRRVCSNCRLKGKNRMSDHEREIGFARGDLARPTGCAIETIR
jgi:hypothetical protein